MTSPPFHLRRIWLIWLPLFAVGVIFFALTAPHHPHAGLWALIPASILACICLDELTQHKEAAQ